LKHSLVTFAAVLLTLPHLGAQPEAFEVATTKPAAPNAAPKNQVVQVDPARISIPSMTLTALIYAAWGNGGFNTAMRVTGGPDWVNKTAFSVEALAAGPTSPRQMRQLLQTLLTERFALKLGHTEETGDILTLVVDRADGALGPKIKRWDGTCPASMPALYFQAQRRPLQRIGDKFSVGPASEKDDPEVPYCPTGYRANGGIRIDGGTMRTVAEMLSLPPSRALLGTITYDRTGLTDRYTMELDYPFVPGGPAVPGAPPEFASPSLADAVREQWGLRLVRGKGPLKVILIESAQGPTEN
jgi:uncharacterized protein (TIGR03435 family)